MNTQRQESCNSGYPEKFILEESSNVHTLETERKVFAKNIDGDIGGIILKVEGPGIVTHGEHHTLVTETPDIIKINQQEINPLTKKMQNAFD